MGPWFRTQTSRSRWNVPGCVWRTRSTLRTWSGQICHLCNWKTLPNNASEDGQGSAFQACGQTCIESSCLGRYFKRRATKSAFWTKEWMLHGMCRSWKASSYHLSRSIWRNKLQIHAGQCSQKHTSWLAKAFYEEEGINWWPTPASSVDFNPIERVWRELKYFLAREVKPMTKKKLVDGIKAFWSVSMTAAKCEHYIEYAHVALPKIIDSEGGITGEWHLEHLCSLNFCNAWH